MEREEKAQASKSPSSIGEGYGVRFLKGEAQAEVAAAAVGLPVAPNRNAAAPRVAAPTATTEHAVRAR